MIDCLWKFTGPTGSNIFVTLNSFMTEANDDIVTIGSGGDHLDAASILYQLDGTVATVTYQITSTQAWISFATDLFTSDTGFSIDITAANTPW